MIRLKLRWLAAWCALFSTVPAVDSPLPPSPLADEQLLNNMPQRPAVSESWWRTHSLSSADHNTPYARRVDQWHMLQHRRQEHERAALADRVAQLRHGPQQVHHAIADVLLLSRVVTAERAADRLVRTLNQQIQRPPREKVQYVHGWFHAHGVAPAGIAALAREDATAGEPLRARAGEAAVRALGGHHSPTQHAQAVANLEPFLESIGRFLRRRREQAPQRAELVAEVRALERYVPALARVVGERPPRTAGPAVRNSRWLLEETRVRSVAWARTRLTQLREKRDLFLRLATMRPAEYSRTIWHL